MNTSTYITPDDLQVRYQKLFTSLRDHIWEFDVVKSLAELEVSIYRRFLNKDDMLRNLEMLDSGIRETYQTLSAQDLDDFEKAFQYLQEGIESYEDVGAELYFVTQLPENSETITGEPESTEPVKRKFSIGNIIKEDDVLEEI